MSLSGSIKTYRSIWYFYYGDPVTIISLETWNPCGVLVSLSVLYSPSRRLLHVVNMRPRLLQLISKGVALLISADLAYTWYSWEYSYYISSPLHDMATASIRPQSTRNTLSSRKGGKDGFPKPNNVILLDALGSGTYATVYKGILKVPRYTTIYIVS